MADDHDSRPPEGESGLKPGGSRTATTQPVPDWRTGVDVDRRKRRRKPGDNRGTLRRMTVTAAVAATGLNTLLFIQTAAEQYGPGVVQSTIIAAVNGLFPGTNPQPPSPGSGGTPVVTTGGS